MSDRDQIQGFSTANITLPEYGDYECPYSAQRYSVLKTVQHHLGDQLRVVFRHFPQTQHHPEAQHTAEAAEAAATQGKFWEMHELLLDHQGALTDADLVGYAILLQLDLPPFLSEMAAHCHARRGQEDIESGISSDVERSPALFLNNIRYDTEPSVAALLLPTSDHAHRRTGLCQGDGMDRHQQIE